MNGSNRRDRRRVFDMEALQTAREKAFPSNTTMPGTFPQPSPQPLPQVGHDPSSFTMGPGYNSSEDVDQGLFPPSPFATGFDYDSSEDSDQASFSESELHTANIAWEEELDAFEDKDIGPSMSSEGRGDQTTSISSPTTAPQITNAPQRGLQLGAHSKAPRPQKGGWMGNTSSMPSPTPQLGTAPQLQLRGNIPLPKRKGGALNIPNAVGPQLPSITTSSMNVPSNTTSSTNMPTRPQSPLPQIVSDDIQGKDKKKPRQKGKAPKNLTNPAPNLRTLTDQDVIGYDAGVGAGQINSVDKVAYNKLFNRQNPKSNVGFFKSDEGAAEKGLGEAATAVGITPGDERPSNRAVATSVTDEMLGLGVAAKTRFAQHTVGREDPKTGKQERVLAKGAVSEAAKGQALKEEFDAPVTDPSTIQSLANFSDEELALSNLYLSDGTYYRKGIGESFVDHDFQRDVTQRGMNDLQWEDALTGQVDRHSGNIFIDPKTGKVTAIDHDAAFGSNALASNPMAMARNENDLFSPTGKSHNRGLPDLIDATTAAKFRNLDWSEMAAAYQKAGLSQTEIAAAKDRLDVIRIHIDKLEAQGNIVGATDGKNKAVGNFKRWGKRTFAAELKNAPNSYLGTAVSKVEEARNVDATDDSMVPRRVGKVRNKGWL
jgi:hypothetical protein